MVFFKSTGSLVHSVLAGVMPSVVLESVRERFANKWSEADRTALLDLMQTVFELCKLTNIRAAYARVSVCLSLSGVLC